MPIQPSAKKLARDVVAVSFNRIVERATTDARLAEPDVGQFMKHGERPSGLRILAVDHDEWRHGVGQGKAKKHVGAHIGMVAFQIADHEHKGASCLILLPQEMERGLDCPLPTEFMQIEFDGLSYSDA